MSLPDFEDPDFDVEAWVEDFADPGAIGEVLESLLDRPSHTTVEDGSAHTTEDGSAHTTVAFVGQELDALRALVQRLRALG